MFYNLGKDNRGLFDLIYQTKDESEIDSVGFYDIHEISKKYKLKHIPRINDFIIKVRKKGKKISRSHFSGTGFRTNLGIGELKYILFR